jgi:ABC-type nitrate/sulfonate/bicarbonate transport system substrate-binding protein
VKEDLSDSELREKLAAWRIEAQLPSDFQQRVWKRIAVREAASVDPIWLTWLKSHLISATRVSVPRLALAAVVAGLLVGTTTGVVESSRWNSATWNRLEAKYVQSIDPYQRIPSS